MVDGRRGIQFESMETSSGYLICQLSDHLDEKQIEIEILENKSAYLESQPLQQKCYTSRICF